MTFMSVETANPTKLSGLALATVLKPAPPVDYLEYAETKVHLSERETPYPGPYNSELFCYFNEVLNALHPDDPCRVVTLAKSAQLGGTVLANIFTCGSIEMDPGDFLYVHPTEGNAKRWSKMKLSPMLKNSASLKSLFPQSARDGSDSVLYKERKDGQGAIQISGANSPASLSQVTMKRQVQDDLAKWEVNAGGDPEAQADSRSQAHEFAKIFKISTPLLMPGCRITRNYEDGSQEKPYVPCPHCGHMQVLTWANMLENLDEDKPEEACFYCESEDCGAVIEEHHKKEMLKGLEWRADNPKAKRQHRSFWIWSAYSVLQTFERIARSWLKAKGDPAREQTFLNDVVGLAYQAQGDAPPWELLRDRGLNSEYARGTIPPGALVITIGIDCQKDRVEWHLVGWGRNKDRYVIDYGVIPGHISEDDCQQQLSALVKQSWPNAFGRQIGADRVGIDGNAYTEDVWSWVKKHPASRVMMVRGNNSDSAPILQQVKKERHSKTGKLLKWSKRFYSFNSSVMKMALYRNCLKDDPLELGYVAFPTGLEDEYFRQLTAERRVLHKTKEGFDNYKWEKDAAQANEALDTMNQAQAAAIRFGIRDAIALFWDKYEAERESFPKDIQGDFEDLLTLGLPKSDADPEPAAEATGKDKAAHVANDKKPRQSKWRNRTG